LPSFFRCLIGIIFLFQLHAAFDFRITGYDDALVAIFAALFSSFDSESFFVIALRCLSAADAADGEDELRDALFHDGFFRQRFFRQPLSLFIISDSFLFSFHCRQNNSLQLRP